MTKDRIDGAVIRSTTWTSDGLLDHIERETLRQTIDEYFTNKTFSLDILGYLTRSL